MHGNNLDIELNNGVKIPPIMLGTYAINKNKAVEALQFAYEAGFRGIDCARYYKNEHDWGKAIAKLNISRSDIFIQTKVDFTREYSKLDVISDFELTQNNFRTHYIDALLIHFPVGNRFLETWADMEKLYRAGKVRAIGVCNFRPEHFEMLKKTATIVPMINQFERHPCRKQNEILDYCFTNHIQPQAYSPLAVCNPKLLYNPVLLEIAKKYHCTSAQVSLAWNICSGVIPLPRSKSKTNISANAKALDICLTERDMEEINGIDAYCRALNEARECPGYWDIIHRVDESEYLGI